MSDICSIKKIFPNYIWLFPWQVLTRPGLPFPSWQKVSGWKGFGLETEFLIWPVPQMGLLFLAKCSLHISRKSSIIQRDLSNANSLNKNMCHDRRKQEWRVTGGADPAKRKLSKPGFQSQEGFWPSDSLDRWVKRVSEHRGAFNPFVLRWVATVYWFFLCLTLYSLRSTKKHHLTFYWNCFLSIASILQSCSDIDKILSNSMFPEKVGPKGLIPLLSILI